MTLRKSRKANVNAKKPVGFSLSRYAHLCALERERESSLINLSLLFARPSFSRINRHCPPPHSKRGRKGGILKGAEEEEEATTLSLADL